MHRTHFWKNLHQDQSLKSRKPNNLKVFRKMTKGPKIRNRENKLGRMTAP